MGDWTNGTPGSFWHNTYAEPTYWSPSRQPHRVLAGWKKLSAAVAAAAVAICAGWGLLVHTLAAERTIAVVLGIATGAQLIRGFHRWPDWQHHRTTVKPLAWSVAGIIDQAAAQSRAWLEVPPDYLTREDGKVAVIDVPHDFTGADRDMEDIARAVTVKLGIEAPDVDKKLASRHPKLIYSRSAHPPDKVTWDEMAAHMRAADADSLLAGLGKKNAPIAASLLLDSPHFGINTGSGGGKSNLATFWMLQELRRGAIVLILDPKDFSYPWAFKDMDAEYGLLPNVRYCRRNADLHNGMVWLGQELKRRTAVAERAIDAGGRVHADVGPRLLIVCEEMNLAEGRLKEYWAECRAADRDLPRRSPAFTGLGAVSYAGRASKMHLVMIGQMLTAASLGGGAVRENIGVKCLSRYSPNAWRMQVGDMAMPPAPWTPGRMQCVAGGEINEVQTPWMHEDAGMDGGRIRELAISGIVTPCPLDMPGSHGVMLPAVVGQAHASFPQAPEQAFVVGQDAGVLPSGRGPADAVTLAEAVAEGLFVSIAAARQARQRQGWEDVGGDKARGYKYKLSDIYAYKRGHRGDDSQ